MKSKNIFALLLFCIMALASVCASIGIFSADGSGPYGYETIRGRRVEIYGRGIYRHMTAGVAPQGIAQDYVTLWIM